MSANDWSRRSIEIEGVEPPRDPTPVAEMAKTKTAKREKTAREIAQPLWNQMDASQQAFNAYANQLANVPMADYTNQLRNALAMQAQADQFDPQRAIDYANATAMQMRMREREAIASSGNIEWANALEVRRDLRRDVIIVLTRCPSCSCRMRIDVRGEDIK